MKIFDKYGNPINDTGIKPTDNQYFEDLRDENFKKIMSKTEPDLIIWFRCIAIAICILLALGLILDELNF